MASAGRCSELQALVFDPKYIQFNPKGEGVTLYFGPGFMQKNQRPNQPHTGKSDFGAPNCLEKSLRYFHMTEHPELRKGRRRLFIPMKDNSLTRLCLIISRH